MSPMSLPPGFRFHPTDEELVSYYLDRKIKGQSIDLQVIPEVDLYKCEPWDLPDKSYLPSKDMEWYFYSRRDRKYPNGSRTNRATQGGYWKATGKDRPVYSHSKITVGMKKTLVYYRERAPHGIRTNWIMHEYRLTDSSPVASTSSSPLKDSYALCRVFKKNIVIANSKNKQQGFQEKESMHIVGFQDSYTNEDENDIEINDYSKSPSNSSSSELIEGTIPNKFCLRDDVQIQITSDETNNSNYSSFFNWECEADFIQDIRSTNFTNIYHGSPYTPLPLEDFQPMNLPMDPKSPKPDISGERKDEMSGTMILEEIYSLCSWHEEISNNTTMQDET